MIIKYDYVEVLFFIGTIFVLPIVVAIINYLERIKEHRLRRKEYIKNISELFPLDSDKKQIGRAHV